jgi:uncharacterized protein YjdB
MSGRGTAPRSLVAITALAVLGALACADEVIRPQCVLVPSVDSIELTLGQTAEMRATPSCVGVAAPRVRWTSSAPDVVAVDSLAGVVTARQVGEATLHAWVVGVASDTADVRVRVNCAATPTIAPTITPQTLVLPVGGTARLQASVPRPCGAPPDTVFAWQSLDASIATVDATTGVVTAIRVGQTVVRATQVANPTVSASVPVTVTAPNGSGVSLAVAPTNVVLPPAGTVTLTTSVTLPPSAPPGTSTGVAFRVADSCVARVSASGVVTGGALGLTTLTVLARADTNVRTTVGVQVGPPMLRPFLVQSIATFPSLVPIPFDSLHGTIAVTLGVDPLLIPGGGTVELILAGRSAASGVVPARRGTFALVPVTLSFDVDRRDPSGARVYAVGPQMLVGVLTTNPSEPIFAGCAAVPTQFFSFKQPVTVLGP